MTSYYWGKALMNDSYVLAGDKQNFSDNNIELRDSMARIHLKKEESKGKVWDTTHGFLIHPFAYSSGLISTSQSFRQKHGRFEAKIRFSSAWPLLHAFWMVGESMTPQIDIFKTSFRKNSLVECGLHTGEKEQKSSKMRKINGAKFAGNFFIYSLDWSPESLIWCINGKEVHRQTNNIPQESMYLTFSTRSEEHTSELQSRPHLVCRLLLEKKKKLLPPRPHSASLLWLAWSARPRTLSMCGTRSCRTAGGTSPPGICSWSSLSPFATTTPAT